MNNILKNFSFLSIAISFWIVAIYWFGDTNTTDIQNSYNRNFDNNISIQKRDEHYKNIHSYPMFHVNSRKNLIFSEEFSNKTEFSNFVLRFIDPNTLIMDEEIKVDLPQHSSIHYASKEKVFFRKGLLFYEFDIKTKTSKELNIENTRLADIVPISNDKAICLGSVFNTKKKVYSFSFFVIDLHTMSIDSIQKEIESNSSDKDFFKNTLKYAGRFVFAENNVVHVYNKYGKIALFNNSGEFLKEFGTIDKISPPEITEFNGMYTYTRGSTFSSNSSAFIKGDHLYTFSCKPYQLDYIMIDKYDIDLGKYETSYKLVYSKKNSGAIELSYQSLNGDNIILGFRDHYQSFAIKKWK